MATQLVSQTLPGAPGGMNTALAAQEIDDTECVYLQDGLLDFPGMTRRRGPLQAASGFAALTRKSTGLLVTLDPNGEVRYAVLNGNASNGYLSVYSNDLSSLVDLAWPHPLPTDPDSGEATAYRIVNTHAAIGGGLLIGVSSRYDSASGIQQGLALWHGGTKANAALTITVARGSAAVTGTGFTANVTPGMFVFSNTDDPYTAAYVGVVQTVNSDTSLTLTAVSPYAITAKSATFQSIRGLAPKITTGRITCATNSAVVNGGSTKFTDQGLGTGSWNLYRKNDLTWIGKVSSVASNTQLTLAANAAIALADAEYLALKADADFNIVTTATADKVGFLTAAYAGRQWYLNNGAAHDKTFRVWLTDEDDPEALDLTEDGDHLEVTSAGPVNEPGQVLAPAYNGLLVLKENEAFIIPGQSKSQFVPKKLEDDGTLSGMSVQLFGGGVIWAGREGIHYYDGITVNNLTQQKLGDVWKNTIKSFDPDRYRMWSMLDRDHYLLHIENIEPTIAVVKGNVSTTPPRWTVVINMITRAVTLATNLNIRGAVTLPASSSHRTLFLANDATKGYILDGDALFDAEGPDAFACDGGTVGPDFYFESKKFDGGDALRLKRFKELLMHYLVQGGSIKVDTVVGLNDIGDALTRDFPASVYTWTTLSAAVATWTALKNQFATWSAITRSVFVPKPVRFSKKSTHFSFRLYQSSSAITRLKVGPFQILHRPLRLGRV